MNSGAPEGYSVPAPQVTLVVVLFLLKSGDKSWMGKWQDCDFDKLIKYMYVLICDTLDFWRVYFNITTTHALSLHLVSSVCLQLC